VQCGAIGCGRRGGARSLCTPRRHCWSARSTGCFVAFQADTIWGIHLSTSAFRQFAAVLELVMRYVPTVHGVVAKAMAAIALLRVSLVERRRHVCRLGGSRLSVVTGCRRAIKYLCGKKREGLGANVG
jgi:hypothetical protein